MEKKIEVCIGTDRSGHVRARLSLLILENGKVQFEHYHSINIAPGADLAVLRAANEAHLAMPDGSGIPWAPWPVIPDAEWVKVEKCCAAIQTPELVEAYQAKLAEQAARQAEQQLRAAMAGGKPMVQ